MEILDLFAGAGGELRRAEIERRGHKYTTLDNNPDFGCDITADIMSINNLGLYDFIWASPPCETWSVASIGHHWSVDNTPKTKSAAEMVNLVKHTLRLINESAKTAWIIENPRGKLRKMPFMDMPRTTVTYCQYGDTRMKPTDLWHVGLNWTSRPMCKNGDTCHQSAPRGAKTGTQGIKGAINRSIVPMQLWDEILSSLERNL